MHEYDGPPINWPKKAGKAPPRDDIATARKQALAEAEDFVRRHGEEELADGIAALTQPTAKGEGE
jgi:hypothetical protein